MADEVGSAALSAGQKTIEVSAELIKLLAPLAGNLISAVFHKSVDGINTVGNLVSNLKNKGTVSSKELFIEAQKANSGISTTSNILGRDVEQFVLKAKQYNIPVAVIGNAEKQTIEFLDRDKGIIEQITNELLQERLKEAPQSVKCFTVNENSVTAIKAAFEANGLECQFMQSGDGKIKCIYPAENAEQVAVIKEDYRKMHSEVAENFSISTNVPETERQIKITARIDELKNAERGSPVRTEAYDRTISDIQSKGVEFPKYSENNTQIIQREMPDAKQVAGKAFWESQGYTLNDDAKGIEIVAPEIDKDGNPVLDENGKQRFTTTTVYDISETNAYDKAISGQITELRNEYAAEKANALKMSDQKEITITDTEIGKSVTLSVEDMQDKKFTKENISNALQKEFGYSAAKADIAANKFAYELGIDKEQFFAAPTQLDNINALKTNIRYQSDDLTLRELRFDAVNFKDGGDPHIVIQNGDKAAALTPDRMTEAEMKKICVNQLGMSEYQADKALEKTVKINQQVKSQVAERTVDKNGISQEVHIERTSQEHFTVQLGDRQKSYNLAIPNAADRIAADFGIPKENAKNIVEKAQKQSPLQNRIRNTLAKKKKPALDAPKISKKGLKH